MQVKKQRINKPASKPASHLKQHKKINTGILLLLIVILVIATFSPTFQNDYTNWDDQAQITENPDIQNLSSQSIVEIFSSTYVGMYQPVTTTTYALLHAIFGLNPTAFHSFSLMLHLINVILVFLLISRFTGNKALGLGVCLLFGVTPMQTEVVAWASATSSLLYSMFFLLALLMYIRYVQSGRNVGHYMFSLTLYLIALMSKSAALTLPLVMLACDYFLNRKITKTDLANKIPFLALSVVFGILTIITRKEAGDALAVPEAYTIIDRFFLILFSLTFYIFNLLLPVSLSAFHTYPEKTGNLLPWFYYAYPLLLAGLIFFVWRLKKQRRDIVFGLVFFVLSISVMIDLIPAGEQYVKERYTYIPSIGVFFSLLIYLYSLSERNIRTKKYVTAAVIALALVFSTLSYARTLTWNNSLALWNNVIEKNPGCSVAFNNRGNLFYDMGMRENALSDYNKAIELRHDYPEAWYNRGIIHFDDNRFNEAINDYSQAITLKPSYAEAYLNRGAAYDRLLLFDKAIADYSKAIAIDSTDYKAYNNRGVSYYNEKKYNQAIEDHAAAIKINPNDPQSYANRANCYFATSNYIKAIEDYSLAISINPEYIEAIYFRSISYERTGNIDNAISDLTTLISIKPDMTDAYMNRGILYGKKNMPDNAITDFTKVIELNPGNKAAYWNRGIAFGQKGMQAESEADFKIAGTLP